MASTIQKQKLLIKIFNKIAFDNKNAFNFIKNILSLLKHILIQLT